jgi:hypothetical protein
MTGAHHKSSPAGFKLESKRGVKVAGRPEFAKKPVTFSCTMTEGIGTWNLKADAALFKAYMQEQERRRHIDPFPTSSGHACAQCQFLFLKSTLLFGRLYLIVDSFVIESLQFMQQKNLSAHRCNDEVQSVASQRFITYQAPRKLPSFRPSTYEFTSYQVFNASNHELHRQLEFYFLC